jgi:hypothetical protein
MSKSLRSDRMDYVDATSSVHIDYASGPAKSLDLNHTAGAAKSIKSRNPYEPAKSIEGLAVEVGDEPTYSPIAPSATLNGDPMVETREQQLTSQLFRKSGMTHFYEQQLKALEEDKSLLRGESSTLEPVERNALLERGEVMITQLKKDIHDGRSEMERLKGELKTEQEETKRAILEELGASEARGGEEGEGSLVGGNEVGEVNAAMNEFVRRGKQADAFSELLHRAREVSDSPRTSLWEGSRSTG